MNIKEKVKEYVKENEGMLICQGLVIVASGLTGILLGTQMIRAYREGFFAGFSSGVEGMARQSADLINTTLDKIPEIDDKKFATVFNEVCTKNYNELKGVNIAENFKIKMKS